MPLLPRPYGIAAHLRYVSRTQADAISQLDAGNVVTVSFDDLDAIISMCFMNIESICWQPDSKEVVITPLTRSDIPCYNNCTAKE